MTCVGIPGSNLEWPIVVSVHGSLLSLICNNVFGPSFTFIDPDNLEEYWIVIPKYVLHMDLSNLSY